MAIFEPDILTDYYPLKVLLDESSYFICEGEDLDSKALLTHIKEAEKQNKIAIFHQATFHKINVLNQEFTVPIIFSECRFVKKLKFTNDEFLYQLFFYDTVFEKSAKFKLSCFFNGVSFIKSKFLENVSFERSKFFSNNVKHLKKEYNSLEIAFPRNFNLRNTVDFLGVEFLSNVSFVNSHCGCSILFSSYKGIDTEFKAKCDFSCISDENENYKVYNKSKETAAQVNISLDKFHRLTFLGVKFYGEATWENRTFQKKTAFRDVVFYYAPKFHNCDLHQDTDFHGADFKDTHSDGAERAYRTLKLMMDSRRARMEEAMFFALEQRSMLHTPLRSYNSEFLDSIRMFINKLIMKFVSPKIEPVNWTDSNTLISYNEQELHSGFYVSLTEKVISFFYMMVSNYGQSVKRPIILLLINLFCVFPLVYMYTFGDIWLINGKWSSAYHLSMQQLFRPFEIFTVKFLKLYGDLPLSLYLVTTFQAICNIGFMTLFILAVRGRFRMF
jgi:uncharacterized protein YjbI with pentapeptide repeats